MERTTKVYDEQESLLNYLILKIKKNIAKSFLWTFKDLLMPFMIETTYQIIKNLKICVEKGWLHEILEKIRRTIQKYLFPSDISNINENVIEQYGTDLNN